MIALAQACNAMVQALAQAACHHEGVWAAKQRVIFTVGNWAMNFASSIQPDWWGSPEYQSAQASKPCHELTSAMASRVSFTSCCISVSALQTNEPLLCAWLLAHAGRTARVAKAAACRHATTGSRSPCAQHIAAPLDQVDAALRCAGTCPAMERVTDTPLDGQQSLQLSDVPPQTPVHLVHHALSHKRQAPAGSGKANPKSASESEPAGSV